MTPPPPKTHTHTTNTHHRDTQEWLSEHVVDETMEKYDADKSGAIDFEEVGVFVAGGVRGRGGVFLRAHARSCVFV